MQAMIEKFRMWAVGAYLLAAAMLPQIAMPVAHAERIENQVAVFSGLDKVTARIESFEVPLNTKRIFGVLEITARSCYSRPPTETPKTTAFVEVSELRSDAAPEKIFAGWMFADSPGLNAVEHPVYDVWLTNCKTTDASPSSSNE
jgi:hypothetical protein